MRAVVVAAVAVVAACVGGFAPAAAQAAPAISSGPPPPGVAGNGYLHQFTASGQAPDTTFWVRSGQLPPGLVLSPVGFVTGVPLGAGSFGPTTVCGVQLGGVPACQTFTIVVAKRVPAILAAPSTGGALGTVVRATGTLVGALVPTGSMTFRLFSDPACRVEVFRSTNPLNIAGVATSNDFAPRQAAVHRWTVQYSGDANNAPVSTVCDAANSVVISGSTTSTPTTTAPPPTTTTVPSTTTTTTTTSTTTPPPVTTTTSTTTTSTTTTSTTTTAPPPASTTSSTIPPTTAPPPTTALPPVPTTVPVAPPPIGTTSTSTTTTTTTVPSTGSVLDAVSQLGGWLLQALGLGGAGG